MAWKLVGMSLTFNTIVPAIWANAWLLSDRNKPGVCPVLGSATGAPCRRRHKLATPAWHGATSRTHGWALQASASTPLNLAWAPQSEVKRTAVSQ